MEQEIVQAIELYEAKHGMELDGEGRKLFREAYVMGVMNEQANGAIRVAKARDSANAVFVGRARAIAEVILALRGAGVPTPPEGPAVTWLLNVRHSKLIPDDVRQKVHDYLRDLPGMSEAVIHAKDGRIPRQADVQHAYGLVHLAEVLRQGGEG